MAVWLGLPELAKPARLPGQAPHSARPEPEALPELALLALPLRRVLAPEPRVEPRLDGPEQAALLARRVYQASRPSCRGAGAAAERPSRQPTLYPGPSRIWRELLHACRAAREYHGCRSPTARE